MAAREGRQRSQSPSGVHYSVRHRMYSNTMKLTLFLCILMGNLSVLAFSSSPPSRTSLVTGASGYLGRAIVNDLIYDPTCTDVICLVRPQRVKTEQEYWNKVIDSSASSISVQVLPYDMLDGGKTLEKALESAKDGTRCVYHVASVFGPTEDHKQTALDNVQGTEDLVRTLADSGHCKLILTSSMAAVRASGQEPANGKYYTHEDWNTMSELGANWGASYQWSKAQSERRAWDLCKELGVPMVSLCPSFIFGPPVGSSSGSFSITLVGQWARGESPVQSRLFVDNRDVAAAHVAAGKAETAVGNRYIVSTEARIPSQEIAEWLKDVCKKTGLSDPEKVHSDADFAGGAIPIGQQEVEAENILQKELGVTLRPVKETIRDMAEVLLQETTGQA